MFYFLFEIVSLSTLVYNRVLGNLRELICKLHSYFSVESVGIINILVLLSVKK